MPAIFEIEYITFFEEMEKNNNRSWFQKHRDRYANHVRKPFLQYVSLTAKEIQKGGGKIETDPARCISRINSDIQFSRDKSPYNLYMTAFFSPKGSKEKSLPGFFLRFGARDAFFMIGCYSPATGQLQAIRNNIALHTKKVTRIIKNPALMRND